MGVPHPHPHPCRGRLEGNPAVLGLVATFSSIFSVCLDGLCVVCGQLACKMIKSGSKNETPRGGVTEDSLSQSLPFSTSPSLPPSQIMASLPTLLLLHFLFTFPLFPPPVFQFAVRTLGPQVNPQCRRRRGGWVVVGDGRHIFLSVKMAEGAAETG